MRIGSLRISIHAPAKGATQMHFPFPPDTVHFNPRFREGSDFVCRGKSGGLGDFNPRSREGSDRSRMASSYVPDVFQSTLPRRERRDLLSFFTNVYLISIHAPAKGATQAHCASCLHYTFQSTLPRRERLGHHTFRLIGLNFNPRSREGSDETGKEF